MFVYLVILLISSNSIQAWDSEQLEVFDAVDEVKQNFYELLNITKDASNSEIKSAFRTLSLKLHPDKNKDVDTSDQFRNLVTVYEILRSSAKRKYYDEVLVTGLPNWKSGLFYYRFVRKMAVTEVLLILFVIVTIGQYLVNWGIYFERVLTLNDMKTRKKKSKKNKSDDDMDFVIPKPSMWNTLPVQIPRFIIYIIVSIPSLVGFLKSAVKEKIEEINRPPTPEPEPEPVRVKTARKRNKFVVPEGPNFDVQYVGPAGESAPSSTSPPISGGLWTDDDLAELIRLVKKFPPGMTGRWEKIAECLNRSVPEVTFMANRMKENAYRLPTEQEEEEPQVKVKQKTKKEMDGAMSEGVLKWSQQQQKHLEEALAKYPKGAADRWDRISELVPGKTKEECMLRFRYLAEDLKKRKEQCEKSEDIEESTN
ncbi:unnamed protein product [Phyllotreta striolata]|uniref:DnaJ-like protein n=1 Tax=Phyllotreta striolata TaxID=444603 RepID=A0A9N9TZU4_PHYSR|nr:unnamed protein product [Phyllotreta striolata]